MTLSRRTATTRFSPEGCQKQTAPRCCQHPIRCTSQAIWHTSGKQACCSFIDPEG